MKVAIAGAAGRVGCCAAYALQVAGIVSEIVLTDIMKDLVEGEALDLMHGSAMLHDQKICAADISAAAKADLIIITAGLRRKPNESRLDLINRNASLFSSMVKDLKTGGLRNDAILLVVSNPVDILTYLAVQQSGLHPGQVVGLGTLLDTARFSSLIADAVKVAPTQVRALVLGEHGDSMVPVWSSATCNGLSLEKHPDLSAAARTKIFERTRQSGAEVIRLKGGAGWAVGTCIAALVHAIVLDQRKILPVSSLQIGAYGLRDVCISVPTMVGRSGVVKHLEWQLWPRELQELSKSATVVQNTIKGVTLQDS
ncbi:MAG: lactate/malate dehydrogenase family protein [Syntrophobacteraceae bacterium]|jgi:L-lactate dehydrogenase